MSEHLLETSAEGSVYKISTIRLATFFAGPIAGTYMIATNFKTFGDTRKSKLTWLYAGLIIGVILVLSFLPVLAEVPGVVFGIVYFVIANFFVTKYQQKNIDLHLQSGGKEFSKGNAVLVSIIGILLIVAVVFALFFIEDFYFRRYS